MQVEGAREGAVSVQVCSVLILGTEFERRLGYSRVYYPVNAVAWFPGRDVNAVAWFPGRDVNAVAWFPGRERREGCGMVSKQRTRKLQVPVILSAAVCIVERKSREYLRVFRTVNNVQI